jgi:hypothetical protein
VATVTVSCTPKACTELLRLTSENMKMDKTTRLIKWQRMTIAVLFFALMSLTIFTHDKLKSNEQALNVCRAAKEDATHRGNDAIRQESATTREAKNIVQNLQDLNRQHRQDQQIINDLRSQKADDTLIRDMDSRLIVYEAKHGQLPSLSLRDLPTRCFANEKHYQSYLERYRFNR